MGRVGQIDCMGSAGTCKIINSWINEPILIGVYGKAAQRVTLGIIIMIGKKLSPKATAIFM